MGRKTGQLEKLNVDTLTKDIQDDWKNFVISEINNHVVRLSVIKRDFHWHLHHNSDEYFYVIEGKLFVDLEDRTEVLTPGQMITIPKNVNHRTRRKYRVRVTRGNPGLKPLRCLASSL